MTVVRQVVFWLHRLAGETSDHPAVVALTICYHNLLRRWADA